MPKLQAGTKGKKLSPKKVEVVTEKPKTGRPTLYKPEYCDEIIEYAKQRKPFQRFCSDHNILPSTFNLWKENNPAFMEATILARQIMEAWYLEKAMDRCEGSNPLGSDRMISFMLSSVYGYREKSDVVTTNETTVKGKIELDFGNRVKPDFGDDEGSATV
jgi:hypothetical protein